MMAQLGNMHFKNPTIQTHKNKNNRFKTTKPPLLQEILGRLRTTASLDTPNISEMSKQLIEYTNTSISV